MRAPTARIDRPHPRRHARARRGLLGLLLAVGCVLDGHAFALDAAGRLGARVAFAYPRLVALDGALEDAAAVLRTLRSEGVVQPPAAYQPVFPPQPGVVEAIERAHGRLLEIANRSIDGFPLFSAAPGGPPFVRSGSFVEGEPSPTVSFAGAEGEATVSLDSAGTVPVSFSGPAVFLAADVASTSPPLLRVDVFEALGELRDALLSGDPIRAIRANAAIDCESSLYLVLCLIGSTPVQPILADVDALATRFLGPPCDGLSESVLDLASALAIEDRTLFIDPWESSLYALHRLVEENESIARAIRSPPRTHRVPRGEHRRAHILRRQRLLRAHHRFESRLLERLNAAHRAGLGLIDLVSRELLVRVRPERGTRSSRRAMATVRISCEIDPECGGDLYNLALSREAEIRDFLSNVPRLILALLDPCAWGGVDVDVPAADGPSVYDLAVRLAEEASEARVCRPRPRSLEYRSFRYFAVQHACWRTL